MTLLPLPPLRDALSLAGLSADKRLGQHFLLDLNICRKIVRLSELRTNETVIEIGPGPGGLNRALLEAGAFVIAIEKDRRFLAILEALAHASGDRLRIVHADALGVDESSLVDGPASSSRTCPTMSARRS